MSSNKPTLRAKSPKPSTTPQDQPKVFGGLTPEQFQARAQQMGQEIVDSLNKTVVQKGNLPSTTD